MNDEVKYCAIDTQHLPDYKTEGSAGWDLRANGEYEIAPHTTVKPFVITPRNNAIQQSAEKPSTTGALTTIFNFLLPLIYPS